MNWPPIKPTPHLAGISTRRFPVLHSAGVAECGLTCLAMIALYHGHRTNLPALRSRYPLSINGLNLPTLVDIARDLQFETQAMKLDMEGLQVLRTPCILHWDMNHFVVLKKASRTHLTIVDPAVGVRRISITMASKFFTGVALELEPCRNFTPIQDQTNILRFRDFWAQTASMWKYFPQLLVLTAFVQALYLVSPLYLQTVVDKAIGSFKIDLLVLIAIGFGTLAIFGVIVAALRGIVSNNMGIALSFRLNDNLLSHLLRLPISFFESRHFGDIDSRFRSLERIRSFLGGNLIAVLFDSVAAVTSLAVMLSYSVALSALVLGISVAEFGLRMMFFLRMRELTEEQITAAARTTSNFMETIRAITGIKVFGREADRQALWRRLTIEQYNLDVRLGRWNVSLSALRGALSSMENTLVVALASLMTIRGDFSVGMVFAFIAYKAQFVGGAHGLFDKVSEIRMLRLHLERLSEIALAKPEDDQHSMVSANEIKGHLELRDIWFRYGTGEKCVLNGCSLELRAGESVALVGPSGCGKTTLMKVAMGLLEAERGGIAVDGHDLSEIGTKQYRRLVGAVMQDDELLSGTLAENIAFFVPDLDVSRIVECARLASIHDEIDSMPMGYNTLIGDMGSSLSGGQKQRVLLARALYSRPKILFLDEATSHLDLENERIASDAIRQLELTRLIIAHRRETIEMADRILSFVPDGDGGFDVVEESPM